MIRNYFRIALRNLRKSPGYAFINIFGLASGLTCFILILIFVQHEFSYDLFHKNADQVYRVIQRRADAGETIIKSCMDESGKDIENRIMIRFFYGNISKTDG